MSKETAASRKPVEWPCFDGDEIVVHIEICGEVFPFTEIALWRRWERGMRTPDEWAADFCELAETA